MWLAYTALVVMSLGKQRHQLTRLEPDHGMGGQEKTSPICFWYPHPSTKPPLGHRVLSQTPKSVCLESKRRGLECFLTGLSRRVIPQGCPCCQISVAIRRNLHLHIDAPPFARMLSQIELLTNSSSISINYLHLPSVSHCKNSFCGTPSVLVSGRSYQTQVGSWVEIGIHEAIRSRNPIW